jgi:FkbM family methyltransferase
MIAGRFDAEIYNVLAGVLPDRGAVTWDVGAHIGFHTLGFAVAVGPTGRVVSFEPNPSNRTRLQQNLERNPDLASRVEILPCALSNHDGEAAFVFSREIDNGASSMSFLEGTTPHVDPGRSSQWERSVVALRTLDGIIREGTAPRPDLIKLDVEGAELLVLRGAAETLRTAPPAVIVEVHSARLVFELQQWLTSAGYDLRLLSESAPSRILLLATRDSAIQ